MKEDIGVTPTTEEADPAPTTKEELATNLFGWASLSTILQLPFMPSSVSFYGVPRMGENAAGGESSQR